MIDEFYLSYTLELAAEAMQQGDHPFAAVLVKDDCLLLTCINSAASNHDATQHAELQLVSYATQQFHPSYLMECTLYSSTEPCAMCASAIVWSGIGRVVYGCPTEVLAEIVGRTTFLVPCREIFSRALWPPEVVGPLLAEQSAEIHRQFWPTFLQQPKMSAKRPYPAFSTPTGRVYISAPSHNRTNNLFHNEKVFQIKSNQYQLAEA